MNPAASTVQQETIDVEYSIPDATHNMSYVRTKDARALYLKSF